MSKIEKATCETCGGLTHCVLRYTLGRTCANWRALPTDLRGETCGPSETSCGCLWYHDEACCREVTGTAIEIDTPACCHWWPAGKED